MGIHVSDRQSNEVIFRVNFWHWRAIVEAIRSLGVLPEPRVDSLPEPCVGELSQEEARAVATAIRQGLLPSLAEQERLLLDGRRTSEPDDGTLYRSPEEEHK